MKQWNFMLHWLWLTKVTTLLHFVRFSHCPTERKNLTKWNKVTSFATVRWSKTTMVASHTHLPSFIHHIIGAKERGCRLAPWSCQFNWYWRNLFLCTNIWSETFTSIGRKSFATQSSIFQLLFRQIFHIRYKPLYKSRKLCFYSTLNVISISFKIFDVCSLYRVTIVNVLYCF